MKEKLKNWYDSNKENIKAKAKKTMKIVGLIGSGILVEQVGERIGVFKTCVVLKENPEIFKKIVEDEAEENG